MWQTLIVLLAVFQMSTVSRADTFIFRKPIVSPAVIDLPSGEAEEPSEEEAEVPPDCGDNPQPGDYCADGSWYAGLSPDGQVPMYVAAADAGSFAFSTTEIVQSRVQSGQPTSFLGTRFGRENTAYLARTASAHPAIEACVQSTDHGHGDWYLPSKEELSQIISVARKLENNAGFVLGVHSLSSTVIGSSVAIVGIGITGVQPQTVVSLVRCVRRVGHAPGDPVANDSCPEGMVITEQCGNGAFYLGRQSDGTRLFAAQADLPGVYQFKTASTATPGAANSGDGRLNLAGMVEEGLENFPAAAACVAQGDGWYLPSMNEASGFKKLIGISDFPGDGSTQIYLSSTQSATFAVGIVMDKGSATTKSVVEPYSVRCVQRR